jgi:hypothetical protein
MARRRRVGMWIAGDIFIALSLRLWWRAQFNHPIGEQLIRLLLHFGQ